VAQSSTQFAYVGAIDTRISIIPVLDERRNTQYSALVIALVVTAIFLLMLLTLVKGIEKMSIGWIGIAGAITYPLFLIHGRIGALIIQHTANDENKWIVYSVTLIALIGVAYWLLQVEKKVLKWRVFSRLAR
jgi:peptidoglycan/LPS O-acetylase OafA/YrhL